MNKGNMGSENTTNPALKLPVIDFSIKPILKPGTPEWDSLRDQVRQELEEFGCFEACFKKIPLDIRKAFFDSLQDLFDLPLETKLQSVSTKPFHGYRQYPQMSLFESMGIDDSNIHENVHTLTNILWPQGNPKFSKVIQSYSEQLSELDQIIRRMILESLGLEKYLEEHMASTNYHLRLQKYKGPQTTETKVGLKAHTDKSIVTILCQNQVEGLEVQTKNGEWISYKPSPDSFIVIIGDYLYAWANGRLHSPYHRVMISGNEARYSAGLFTIPKAGYIVKTPDELVDQDHPLLFKPFDYGQFLQFFLTEAVEKADQSALKTYCGV